MVMGLFSLGFYGLIGLKLLHDCSTRFQVEVDRPHKGWWPRPEASREGILFLEEEIPKDKEIEFLPDDEPPGAGAEAAWDEGLPD